ncbi:MAG: T9SS type A sorting domain-containing protein [Saprospiraceae bacterium]|nr:T9SS type A sorting domain-containing protein [Saprospiraceae bacterium]
MKKLLILCLSLVMTIGAAIPSFGQCNPDILPPTMACAAGLEVNLEANQMVTVEATDLDGGCTDNCTASADLLFRIEAGIGSQDPPLTTSLTFDAQDVGVQIVTLWAIDESGNAGLCWTEILILDDCQGVNPIPVCIANLEVAVEVGGSVGLSAADILEGSGYCYQDFTLQLDPPSSQEDTLLLSDAEVGLHIVQVTDINTLNACWCALEVLLDCTNDIILPIAICDESITLPLSQDSQDLTILTAVDVNEGSYDNCSLMADLTFSLELAATPSPSMPLTTQLEFTATGTYSPVILWVSDEAGNTNVCFTDVEIIAPSCLPDLTPPTCTAPGDTVLSGSAWSELGVNLNDFIQLDLLFGAAASYDFCGPSVIIPGIEVSLDSCNRPVEVIRSFFSTDLALNISDTVYQSIEIVYGLELMVPSDPAVGNAPPDSLFLLIDGELMSATYVDSLIDLTCDDTTDLVIRTWLIDDPCKDNSEDIRVELPRLDLDNNGELGDAYLTISSLDSIYLVENGVPTVALGPISGKYSYVQTIVLNDTDTLLLSASGQVYIDTLSNCTMDPGEPLLAGWPVKAIGLFSGTIYTDTTEADGSYHFEGICPTDLLLEISLNVPFSYGQGCQTTWEVPCSQNDPGEQNIPVQLNADCPIVDVEISAPFLRRCEANIYTVSYTNYSAEIIPDASLEINLDSYLELTGSSLQATALGNNQFAIDLGDLEPGFSGQVTLNCNLSCEAPLGFIHCSDVYFYPDTLCPPSPEWSGANIEVSGYCDQDSIYLQIRNSGEGNMAGPLGYTIVEDVIMFMQDQFELNASETLDLPPIPSNGNTWRLEAEQEPNHPFPGDVAITVRGCEEQYGGGQENAFPIENPSPFIANDCLANISSFDPNAKSAFPSGYGSSHYIEQNTQIEYLLQFQNTGTDTAFQVILLDTLSTLLDPLSIRTGTSSHKYQFELLQGHIIRFTFDPIILPQEAVNESKSHGFVKFTIDQQTDLALGSNIENKAAIYFDKNDPILTNTVVHTVGEDFIELISDVADPLAGAGSLKVFPNPARADVQFQLDGAWHNDLQFLLIDAMGRSVKRDQFDGNVYMLNRAGLEKGIYFYLIQGAGNTLHSGKVILH